MLCRRLRLLERHSERYSETDQWLAATSCDDGTNRIDTARRDRRRDGSNRRGLSRDRRGDRSAGLRSAARDHTIRQRPAADPAQQRRPSDRWTAERARGLGIEPVACGAQLRGELDSDGERRIDDSPHRYDGRRPPRARRARGRGDGIRQSRATHGDRHDPRTRGRERHGGHPASIDARSCPRNRRWRPHDRRRCAATAGTIRRHTGRLVCHLERLRHRHRIRSRPADRHRRLTACRRHAPTRRTAQLQRAADVQR